MIHGGDIYSSTIEYDFSVSLNPIDCSELSELILEKSAGQLSCYPDYEQNCFRTAVAETEGIKEREILGGNGASELLMSIVRMINPNRVMLISPCFSGYDKALKPIENCEVIRYKTSEDTLFKIDESFLRRLKKEAETGIDLLIIANPNNPTGMCIDREIQMSIINICRCYGIKVIVDECFIKLSSNGQSMVRYINDYDGLYVVNAYTKLFSIPGIRVGYAVSDEKNINRLKDYLPEWNMSVIAQNCGEICANQLMKTDFAEKTRITIDLEKKYMTEKLKEIGFKVFKSDTCFLLFKTDDEGLGTYLKDKGILIRDCSNFDGLQKGYFRIGLKSRLENDILLNAIRSRRY